MIYYPFSPKQNKLAYLFDIASYQINYAQHFSIEIQSVEQICANLERVDIPVKNLKML